MYKKKIKLVNDPNAKMPCISKSVNRPKYWAVSLRRANDMSIEEAAALSKVLPVDWETWENSVCNIPIKYEKNILRFLATLQTDDDNFT